MEVFMQNNQFFTTYEETEKWLKAMHIANYIIHEDLTVDVDGRVKIDDKNLTHIPVQFGYVSGNFICNDNNLKNLKGCPKVVDGTFYCNGNSLKSLEGSPHTVGGHYYCDNNQLKSLEGCPLELNGSFGCSNNQLTSLESLTVHILNLYCQRNSIKNYDIFDNLNIEKIIIFTPTKDMKYLDNYKDNQGDIRIEFDELRKIKALQKLNEKLTKELPIKPINIKQKI